MQHVTDNINKSRAFRRILPTNDVFICYTVMSQHVCFDQRFQQLTGKHGTARVTYFAFYFNHFYRGEHFFVLVFKFTRLSNW